MVLNECLFFASEIENEKLQRILRQKQKREEFQQKMKQKMQHENQATNPGEIPYLFST